MAFFTQIVFRRKDAPLAFTSEIPNPSSHQRKIDIVRDRAIRTFDIPEPNPEVILRNGVDYAVNVDGQTFVYYHRDDAFHPAVTDAATGQSRAVRTSVPIRRREDIPRALAQAMQIFRNS